MDASMNMTQGKIGRTMIAFAIPIFLGQLFQQLYNTADSLIVGNLSGSQALAAVSSSGNLIQLLVGFFNGMSMGASVVIAQSFGAGNQKKLTRTIGTAITFGAILSIVLTVLGVWCTPILLRWMGTPEDVLPLSISYFAVYFSGISGLVMYNQLAAVMRAVGDSRHPLVFLTISSVSNVALDLLLVGVFHMGVAGAAWATVFSQFLSALLAFRCLLRSSGPENITLAQLRLDRDSLKEIVRYGIPTGIQNSIISLANVVVQSHVNAFGSAAMAGIGTYNKLEGFVFLPIMSFNMAISTFVGQNIGAGNTERTLKGARFGILSSMAAAELVGILFFLFAPTLIALFDRNPQVIAFGVGRARWNCLFYCLLAYSHAVSAVLRGGGKPVVPMYVMMILWCAVRIAFLTVTAPFHNIILVYLCYPITWSLSTLFFLWYYQRKTWLNPVLQPAH